MKLNLLNIEEKVLFNTNVVKLLPENCRILADTWKKLYISKNKTQKTLIEILNSIDDLTLCKLRDYFKEDIVIEKVNYNIVQNDTIFIDDLSKYLNSLDFKNNFTIYRNKDNISVTIWR